MSVTLKLNDANDLLLTVKDNGIGLPSEVDIHNTESLGLHLVVLLAEDQLHGSVQVERNHGTSYHIQIPQNVE